MDVVTDSSKIKEVLTRAVERIYPCSEELEKAMASGKRLKLYCGYDPSSPSLHIGHVITFKKLGQFQELGHEVIMLIGDFTGMIGDPTDKTAARRKLTRKEVLGNSKDYRKYAGKFIKFSGKNSAKVLYNSQWSDKLRFSDLIEISSNFTVQQMIVRDMFQERLSNKKPIFLHEFLYPLAQAYDSVAMDVDLEIGGRDQTFNMLCGRGLMRALKNKEKYVLTVKLLTDPSGKKMGKTESNMVSLSCGAGEMYGRIMSWPDSLIYLGFELCTDLPMEKIKKIEKEAAPREAKSLLAKEIVAVCHGRESAEKAEREFKKIFQKKEMPSKIPVVKINEPSLVILNLLVQTGLCPSKAEAKRLILQKGVKINGKIQDNWQKEIKIKKNLVVQVGKRKFAKLA